MVNQKKRKNTQIWVRDGEWDGRLWDRYEMVDCETNMRWDGELRDGRLWDR